jgi:hypothetical protein
MKKILIIITLILFGALTVVTVWQHGFIGIFTAVFQSLAGIQVFVDLFIACVLIIVWMWKDAKATNRNVWPWIAITLAIGSFGPLLYLLTGKSSDDKS